MSGSPAAENNRMGGGRRPRPRNLPSRKSRGVLWGSAARPKRSPASPLSQPISQAEIETPFAADKRRLLVKLRDLKLVEEFAGSDGRLHSCSASGLASLQESSASFSIASKNARWSMRPTILISPWHSGQRSGSASQTFLIQFGRSGRSFSPRPLIAARVSLVTIELTFPVFLPSSDHETASSRRFQKPMPRPPKSDVLY